MESSEGMVESASRLNPTGMRRAPAGSGSAVIGRVGDAASDELGTSSGAETAFLCFACTSDSCHLGWLHRVPTVPAGSKISTWTERVQ